LELVSGIATDAPEYHGLPEFGEVDHMPIRELVASGKHDDIALLEQHPLVDACGKVTDVTHKGRVDLSPQQQIDKLPGPVLG
jgi:hypothetical protein